MAILKDLIVNGGARIINGLNVDTINGVSVGSSPKFTDTNTWRPVGSGSTDAAAGNHTHSTTIATSSGTNQLTLAFGTKYALTAGGTSYIFTMPSNPNTNTTYTIATGDSNGQIKVTPSSGDAYNVNVKGLGSAAYTASTAYAASGHTHTTTIASGGTAQITLSASTAYTLTAGGTTYVFKTPPNDNTKNTAGSTDSSSKLFLIGATEQSANPQTYSHDTAYVGTDGCLYSNSTKVSVEGHTHSYASSSHTHATSIASGGSAQVTLSASTAYTLTAGGTTYVFKTPPNDDTKNTAGSTDSSSKLFLVGATSQAANPQTYSHDTAYVGTDGCLYSNSTKVSVEGHTHSYASSSHTHDITLTSGGTSTVSLSAGTAYTLTAGGKSVVFTTPAHQSLSGYSQTSHTHTTTIATDSGTNQLTMEANTKYKLTAGGTTFVFTTPAHQSLSGYSTTSHTHTCSIAADSGTNQLTLAFGTKYKLTAGGNSYIFTMPSNPNTDTKNTAGATDTSSKIYLVGATSQDTNPQTYSQDTAYVGTDGCLYSGGTIVQKGITSTSVTIATTSWSSSQASATVSGVTSSSKIWVTPDESSYDVYTAAGIRGISQTTNSITFQCSSTPTASVTINVAVAN